MKKILLTLLIAVSVSANAEPLKLVVPYAPGGITDNLARYLSKNLNDQGIESIVINKPAAGGTIALTEFVQQPNSKSLLFVSNGLVVAKAVEEEKINEAVKSTVPIIYITSYPNVIVANKSLGVSTWKQIQILSKNKKINLAASSSASLGLIDYVFKDTPNVVSVPYNGDSKLMPDLLGGQIDVANITYPGAVPHIKSGALVPIMVTTDQQFGNIPTLKEQGINFSTTSFIGVVGSPELTRKESQEYYQLINKIFSTVDGKEFIKNAHSSAPASNKPEDLLKIISDEQRNFRHIVQKK